MLEKLIELDDKNDKYFFQLGVCHLCDGQPAEAIPHLVQSIVINRENLEAQIQLAIAHELVEEEELSLMIYNKLIETNPEFLKAYYNKAAMLMGMGDFEGEDVEIIFNRDILISEGEVIDNCQKSVGVLSDETIVANHPWVDDPQAELERLKKQKEEAMEDYAFNPAVPIAGDGQEKQEDISD